MKDGNAKAPCAGMNDEVHGTSGTVLLSEKLLHAFQNGVLLRVYGSVL